MTPIHLPCTWLSRLLCVLGAFVVNYPGEGGAFSVRDSRTRAYLLYLIVIILRSGRRKARAVPLAILRQLKTGRYYRRRLGASPEQWMDRESYA